MENIFIAASRIKLRFSTNKGELSVEELWDLSLTSLDNIARSINKQLKDSEEESFIKKKSNADANLTIALEILKAIISTKQEEAEAKSNKVKKAAEIALLKDLLAEKQLDGLKSLTPAEIQEKLAALEAE